MIQIVLASHCDLAKSLLRTGMMICGKDLMNGIHAVTIQEGEHGLAALEKDCQAIAKQYANDDVLILCDIMGATPFNVCLSVFRHMQHTVVTGANLPMLIEASIHKDQTTLAELADMVKNAGQQGVEKVNLKEQQNVDSSEDFL